MTTLKRDPAAIAEKKAERDRDAAQAMADYEADKRATQANMTRLRALRLAKERADAQAAAGKSTRRKTK
ncbi:MAG TPA: transcriptional regulator [Pseudolabrys sp.]|nr:transcriptional regulator [Pseudolabrys sp.]